ncbi:MAG: 30S ribosomal protein S17 [Candidatus Roizmanbacteria bacterium GW2011_GWA2_36_23]|uniref:Small ribosomal subunit protein uS17 n=1 Tax=Candidatus Roizmanbacteria bacterium GW2011_GWA2_36_23 TaxID=1618480 RepID=A0A0G0E9H7_9BACT|nr:MAG: 30S ribosomal protein S17 [Candidatus Roizmanbacteria bacterium GW2011_GWA2_36_23]
MKKTLIGTVVSNKMNKTVVLRVERKFKHHLYNKILIRHKKYKAHNENLDLQIGDIVSIEETKPLSKDKHFKVIKKI